MPGQEPLGVEATIVRLTTLYEAADPRLGCFLVEANVILVIAEARADSDVGLYGPQPEDQSRIEQLLPVLGVWGLRWDLYPETRQDVWDRPFRQITIESLQGYARVSRKSTMRGVHPFDPAQGWEGLRIWQEETFNGLRAAYEPEPILFDRWLGLILGYPDQAIEDACQTLTQGQSFDRLQRASITAVDRYQGALPIFSFSPEHAADPEIVAICAEWGTLLAGVYASDWHQRLQADPAFQLARREREQRKR